MPCPCCLRGLTDPPPPGRLGDRWCPFCEWLFAVEMTGGEDPMALDGLLRCPKDTSGRRTGR